MEQDAVSCQYTWKQSLRCSHPAISRFATGLTLLHPPNNSAYSLVTTRKSLSLTHLSSLPQRHLVTTVLRKPKYLVLTPLINLRCCCVPCCVTRMRCNSREPMLSLPLWRRAHTPSITFFCEMEHITKKNHAKIFASRQTI